MELKPGYKRTEIGVIPEDWDVTTVSDEFSIQLGKMLDAEKNIGVLKPYLGNRAIRWGRIELDEISFVKMTPSDLQRYRLREGDLLVCEGGEIGRAAIWKQPIQECYYQKALHRLRPTHGYNNLLMLNVLQQWASTGFLLNFVTQTSIAHLPKDKFEKVPLPLPPTKAEQKAIAEALSDADALIASLEQLITKKRHLKQGAMQELLTGKKRLPGFQLVNIVIKETEIGNLPDDWEITDVEGVTLSHKQGFYTKDRYVDNGTRLVRITDLMGDTIDFSSMPMLKVSQFELEQFKVNRGDFLFARSGAIGRYGIVHDKIEAVFGSYIIRFVFDRSKISNQYFGYIYQTDLVRKQLFSITQGSSNININAGNIKALKIPLPTTNEQNAITTILLDMDAEIAALETKLAKARQLKAGMMQNLLTGKIRLI